jgi:HNH endonuclease
MSGGSRIRYKMLNYNAFCDRMSGIIPVVEHRNNPIPYQPVKEVAMARQKYTTATRSRDQYGHFIREVDIHDIPCAFCGTVFRQTKSRRRFCSRMCRDQGCTRYVTQQGYINVKVPDHPHATTNGWVYEHIVVATATLGRPLLPNETVHHEDHNKQNNTPENLVVLDRAIHNQRHQNNPFTQRVGEPNRAIVCACGCGDSLMKYEHRRRPRRFARGHNCRGKLPATKGATRIQKSEHSPW